MLQKKQILRKSIGLFSLLFLSQNATAQSCSQYITDDWTNNRYIVHGNGTVTDQATNLMWKQCSEGLSGVNCADGAQTFHTWQDALALPELLNADVGFGGYHDWRLPNIKELQSLAAYNCTAPSINATVFPYGAFEPINPYWSNSPVIDSPLSADNRSWVLSNDGLAITFLRTSNNKVRLVRTVTNP